MDQQTVVQLCEAFLSRQSTSELRSAFEVLEAQYKIFFPAIWDLIGGVNGNQFGVQLNGFRTRLTDAIVQIKNNINLRSLTHDAHAIQKDLVWLGVELFNNNTPNVDGLIEVFMVDYHEFIKHQTPERFIKVLETSHTANYALSAFIETIRTLTEALDRQDQIYEGESVLALYFAGDYDLEQILYKMQRLKVLYDDVARFIGEDPEEWPLRLRSLQTGSLRAKASGRKSIIDWVGRALQAVATEVWKRFSKPGRFARKKEIFFDLLQLRAAFASQGYDTSNLDDRMGALFSSVVSAAEAVVRDDVGVKIDSSVYGMMPADRVFDVLRVEHKPSSPNPALPPPGPPPKSDKPDTDVT